MLERIAKIIKENRGNNDLVITEETSFAELKFDSLETVELVMNFEEEFGVTIELNESIKTVGDIIKILKNS